MFETLILSYNVLLSYDVLWMWKVKLNLTHDEYFIWFCKEYGLPVKANVKINYINFMKQLIEHVLQKFRYKFPEYDKKVTFVNYFVYKQFPDH